MNHQMNLPLQVNEIQTENRLSPLRNKSPLSHESNSFDNDDHECEIRQRNPDVHTTLLRKLSLVGIEEKISRFEFRRRIWFKMIISLTCITSVVSVSLNTPTTFKNNPSLIKITLGLDIAVAIILSTEAAIKCAEKGFLRAQKSYLRSPGRVFEFVMVVFIWVSIIFQGIELTGVIGPYKTSWYYAISWIRSPRPLLLFRVAKNLLHVGIPKNVSKKPLRQIRNVLVFTIYFLTLASLIGVQMFGPLAGYCVRNTTIPSKVRYDDLMIPASRCAPYAASTGGYRCPEPFVCKELALKGFLQMTTYFKQAASGLLTVYEAQSQEGWSAVMYDTMDSNYFLMAVVYFILLIFCIAWLAKNIFIAIVTEVFADLRSQVHNLYSKPARQLAEESTKVLKRSESGMRLIEGREMLKISSFRYFLSRIVRSVVFKWVFLFSVVLDALLQSLLIDSKRMHTQIAFTVLFDIEAILKIISYGPAEYIASIPHRFELFLAVGSSAFLAPLIMKNEEYALFKVMRPFRLILAWPSLESFLKRILGNGRKLLSLIFFTLIFLVAAAGVSLQFFCSINVHEKHTSDDGLFHTFPDAVKAMFQVLMQEAWNDVMSKMLHSGGQNLSVLIFAFFILFHVLAAVILLSVFVALILDNLELDEELKVIKQHQLEEEAEINYSFPLRLRLFENFKARPKIVKMENIGCSIPKVRESFMGNYLSKSKETENFSEDEICSTESRTPNEADNLGFSLVSVAKQQPMASVNLALRKQSSVTALIKESQQRRGFGGGSFRQATVRHRGHKSVHAHSNAIRSLQGTDAKAVAAQNPVASPNKPAMLSLPQRLGEKNLDVDVVRERLQEARRKKETLVENFRENYPYFDKSLFFLSYDSKFRCILRKIVHARYEAFSDNSDRQRFFSAFSLNRFKKYLGSQAYLDWLMIFLTHLSCWVMMLETPEKGTFKNSLTENVEILFVVTTTIEIGLKILADGFFLTPTALARDFGGVLHVFIYIVGLVYVILRPVEIRPGSFAQALLVLRAFRPLRIITLAPPLGKVVRVLVRGYKDILTVAILQLLLMFVFANYGVQMFSGKLAQCTDKSKTKENCTGFCQVTLAEPRLLKNLQGNIATITVPCVWRNPRNFNFDTLQSAFLSLFEVLSLEGWTEVRDILGDRIGWYAVVYLHIYVFFACLIGLSLFIGVVVSNFNENKGIALMTVDQRRWEDLKKRLKIAQPIHIPPRPEDDETRGRMYDFLQTRCYRWIYIGIVLLNGATLLYGEWYPVGFRAYKSGDKDLHLSFTSIAVIFAYIYVIDFALKLKAYRFSGYWLSWRNRFDLIITILGLIWSVFQIASYKFIDFQPVTLQVGVAVIIFRLFTLAGKVNSLRMLMLTVGMSLLKSFFTISVLVVLMMCYAVVGVVLFGSVKFGIALNRHANFRNSWRAMLLLFRITTGEDWNKIMHDCMVAPPRCTMRPQDNFWETDCGNEPAAILFFSSYYLLITYIFLNLFIAVVIENFSLFSSTDEDMLMTNSDLKAYQEVWNLVDTDRSGKLSAKKAKLALGLSIFKLGFSIQMDRFLYKRMCVEIDKISGGKEVSFHDLLLILAYNDSRVKISRNLQLEERLAREDQVRGIVEEVAAQTIRTWCVRMWREKTENRKGTMNRLLAKHSVSSVVSSVSVDSEVSEFDELNASSTSVGSSLIVPRAYPEKKNLTKTTSYPLEQVQKCTNQQKLSETAKQKLTEKYSGPKDIYDWWTEEIGQEM